MGGVRPVNHLGILVSKDDGSLVIYAKAHADLNAYQPYAVQASRDINDNDQDGNNDNTGNAVTKVPITLAIGHMIGVPQRDYDSGDIAELLVGGAGKMTVDNVTGAITGGTSFLKVLSTGVIGQVDGSTQTAKSIALACEDQDSAINSNINVQMLGLPAQV